MGLDTTVVLNSTNYAALADSLKGRGIVDLSTMRDVGSGQKALFVRPGGVFQMLRAWFSGAGERQKQADQVCGRLGAVFDKVPGKESLLQNVRAQIIKEGRLTGEFLALNLKALHEGGVVTQKDVKPYALPTHGQQVRILSGRPTEIDADRCIVGYGTARDLLGAAASASMRREQSLLSKLQVWSVGDHANGGSPVHEFSSKASRAKIIASCPPFNETSAEDRTTQEMFDLTRTAIGDAIGVIVVEPQPDTIRGGKPVCSDAGLTAQIRAALERKADAQQQGLDRVITFVSPDNALLKRIEALHADLAGEQADADRPASRAHMPGSNTDADSDSDSDSDRQSVMVPTSRLPDQGTGVWSG